MFWTQHDKLELFILCGMGGFSLIGGIIAILVWLKAEQDKDAHKAKQEKMLVCLQRREKVGA